MTGIATNRHITKLKAKETEMTAVLQAIWLQKYFIMYS